MEKKKMDESGISRRSFLKISAALGAVASVSGLPALSAEAEAKAKKAAMAPFKQGMINTVLGPISPDKLGLTLVHEHFTFAYPGWYADATNNPYDFNAVLKTNLGVIKAAQKFGIKTIIDATPNDTGGRDPELYKALAQKTGMNIICSTGLYTEHEGAPAYYKTRQSWYKTDIAKLMTEIFVNEITKGIGKSGVRAGVIKCGTSGGGPISPYETAVLKAAVAAQKATGVPIITHTEGPLGGVEQADLFIAEGADLKKVMIGHVSNSKDIEYHRAILAKGVNMAFDRIGLEIITPTDVIIKNVAQLCKDGFANKIMLSHDTVNVWLGRSLTLDTPEPVIKALANWR
ncbi:MAG TPA: twin-arginine translocation signal domain-containing protein, partial [Thermodesulfobacteriota bacterium]|nr:twin-arginine translocation signal domain-containing protein [Thermodesulfobacteriota bacterium]